jgi:hypothetical protein
MIRCGSSGSSGRSLKDATGIPYYQWLVVSNMVLIECGQCMWRAACAHCLSCSRQPGRLPSKVVYDAVGSDDKGRWNAAPWLWPRDGMWHTACQTMHACNSSGRI